ncbi:50S ribosomal protein L11 methyltransferase [Atopobacter phocae]|uniref:50S ribosomal protein L11 methyltransferase n=1 Tax=Atopobacter phocae TaxID=136492 RepID=UPI00046FFB62|nr:50S ribosomal protein L11 methyltransferase [Atopobacter phocae]
MSTNNDWVKITIAVIESDQEVVTNFLMDQGFQGVEVESFNDLDSLRKDSPDWLLFSDDLAQGIQGEVKLSVYQLENEITPVYQAQFKENISQLSLEGPFTVELTPLKAADWQDGWKEFYKPIALTRFMAIVPEWEEAFETEDFPIQLRLDPGLAFGTGSHPTTQLCLLALEQYIRPQVTVCDVGSGSGILSIAAAALGADKVFSYDIDPSTSQIIKENARLNPNSDRIFASEGNLLTKQTEPVDIIVANILAGILELMADDAKRLLKPEGRLILSGIIGAKKQQVAKAFEAVGFELEQSMEKNDWHCLVFKHGEK